MVEFIDLLRQNGVRVSPGETLDAMRALVLVGFGSRETVRAALAATLVKRGADVPVFERVFELYFGRTARVLEALEESLARTLSVEERSLEELQALGRLLEGVDASPFVQAAVGGRVGELVRVLRQASLRVDFSSLKSASELGYYARRVSASIHSQARRDVERLFGRLEELGADASLVEWTGRRVEEALRALADAARNAAELELDLRRPSGDAPLRTRPFETLSENEHRALEHAVALLGEKLRARIGRRRRRARKGELFTRDMLRRNLPFDALPVHRAFRARRPRRPELVVLLDVSESVRHVSRLMFGFLHALQSRYRRVRTFVFVSELAEVSGVLGSASLEEAVRGDVASRAIDVGQNSNYGRALQSFHADFRGAVTRRTTLLVIGDGRSNHNPANAWVLGELRKRAKRVVWFCPEEEGVWGTGDSEMPLYARKVSDVFVVRTFDELSRAVEALLV